MGGENVVLIAETVDFKKNVYVSRYGDSIKGGRLPGLPEQPAPDVFTEFLSFLESGFENHRTISNQRHFPCLRLLNRNTKSVGRSL